RSCVLREQARCHRAPHRMIRPKGSDPRLGAVVPVELCWGNVKMEGATQKRERRRTTPAARSRSAGQDGREDDQGFASGFGQTRYTDRMTFFLFIILALIAGSGLDAQERPVPKDSARVSIPGCAKGRTFIVAARSEAEPVRSDVQPGSRFRLSGQKKLLEEIKKQEKQGSMVEVTGLVRKSQLAGPRGLPIAGRATP